MISGKNKSLDEFDEQIIGERMGRKTGRLKFNAILILLLGIGVMVYTGAQLLDTQRTYQEGKDAYDNLRAQITGNAGTDGGTPAKPLGLSTSDSDYMGGDARSGNQQLRINYGDNSEIIPGYDSANGLDNNPYGNPDDNLGNIPENDATYNSGESPLKVHKNHVPEFAINYNSLRSFSKDAVAWLHNPGTVIDYPVMKTNNYTYYLNHLPDGSVNSNGALFIDYNNAPDFSEQLTVIYGHHMKSGSMFGTLVKYKEQSYYRNRPHMYLYTERGNYRIDLIYGCVISEYEWTNRGYMLAENIDSLLSYARDNSTFSSNASYEQGDRVVALSTCSYEYDDARFVLIGVLRPEYSDI